MASAAEKGEPMTPVQPIPENIVRGKALLLIGDTSLRRLLDFFLKRLGLEVGAAKNSTEALARMPGHDLLLVDVEDPLGEELQEILGRAARQTRRPSVIVLACTLTEGEKKTLLAAGALEVLEKPFSMRELADLIRRAFA